VFSGTGNGEHLVRAISARLGARGLETEIHEASAAEISRLRSSGKEGPSRGVGDLDIFSFPVYAMSVPRLMNRYMRSLGAAPTGASRPKAAVLSTNGRISARWRDGHEGQALAEAERILRRLGWEVVYRDSLDYPQNIAAFLPIQDEERRAAIMALVEPRIAAVAEDLAEGRMKKRPCRPWATLVGRPFGLLYRLVGRRALSMLFAADERCEGCGLCAARCPAGAITMRAGRPAWNYACEGCERCINLCPKRAIQTSLLRVAVMVAIFVAVNFEPLKPFVARGLGLAPTFAFEAAWSVAALILAPVLGLAAMRLVDIGLVSLSRVRSLRPILSFGWTREKALPGPGYLSKPAADLTSLRNSAR
jgi:ferredoxin